MGLVAGCSDSEPTTGDSGQTVTDTDSDPYGLYFDTYAVGWSFQAGFDGQDLRSFGSGGVQQEPMIEVTFYEEAYFSSLNEAYTCTWVGAVETTDQDDLSLGSALWIGWRGALSLGSPNDNTCTGFNPDRWGEDTPTTVLEATPFGVGFGPSSEEFEADLRDSLLASGWSKSDWDTFFGPYLYSTFLGTISEPEDTLLGYEINLTRSYQVDDAWDVLLDQDGYLIPVEVGDDTPQGYVSSQSWRLYEVKSWY